MSSVKWKGDPKYYDAGGKPFPKEEVEFILMGAGTSLTFKFTYFFLALEELELDPLFCPKAYPTISSIWAYLCTHCKFMSANSSWLQIVFKHLNFTLIKLLESPIPAPAPPPSQKASSDDISGTKRGTIDPLVSKRPEKILNKKIQNSKKKCQKWSKMSKMVKNGQNGPKWSKMVPNGPKSSKMVKNGENW